MFILGYNNQEIPCIDVGTKIYLEGNTFDEDYNLIDTIEEWTIMGTSAVTPRTKLIDLHIKRTRDGKISTIHVARSKEK